MIITTQILIILVAVLLACSIGFKKYVYFISIGYGLSISAIGVASLILYHNNLDLLTILANIIFIAYGLRLGGYLLIRELKSAAYNRKMKNEISDGSHMTIPLKMVLWISCALLYITMTAPVIYRLSNGVKGDTCLIVGMCIMVFGILLESLSDLQKSNAKKKNPNRFVDNGLYKIVRCPNYLGELIMWTGVFVSAFTSNLSVGQWIVSVIGYLGIIYIMFSGARRLEIRQDKNYGEDKEYQEYKNKTPIMIPLIPLYSVKKHKWLVG